MGAVLGPLLASKLIQHFGQSTLFLFTAIVHGLTGILAYYRMTRRERVPIEERENFIAVPQTSPEVNLLDPGLKNNHKETIKMHGVTDSIEFQISLLLFIALGVYQIAGGIAEPAVVGVMLAGTMFNARQMWNIWGETLRDTFY